ncbi:MAG: enoyl-CoA hydratase/isomerase family protein [Candidatus Thalassarchaeaceae archaeon]|jgi:2-(1,2-epoxy-1,2-dihydrophenyl)acetyl-CoA isomerase|nr:enoyl-CoA hydratase/isomerase family protein [Candidatus Thalassarchaeaceae archaeon]
MPVSTERLDDGVALVTLSPEASSNTFYPGNFQPLISTLDQLMADPTCRGVVITGSGRFFSVGGNIDDFSRAIDEGTIGQTVKEMTGSLHPLLLRIRATDTVFVCAINGAAAGGGLGLALAADYRICVPEAKIASAFFSLGLSPDGGTTWLLPRLVGYQAAKRFFFDAEVWSGEQALEKGAVDEIASSDDLVERAIVVAGEWGRWSVNSRRSTKQLLDASTSTFFETQLQFEQSLMVASSEAYDFAEGVRAFIDGRPPVFGEEEE